MGYSTTFIGSIEIQGPLNQMEVQWINTFAGWRHHQVEGLGLYDCTDVLKRNNVGQKAAKITLNEPHPDAPGMYCQWNVKNQSRKNVAGEFELSSTLGWDGADKFYQADRWLAFLVEHFIGRYPYAKHANAERFDFVQPHECTGVIYAIGESVLEDLWRLEVKDNRVYRSEGRWNKQWVANQGFEDLDVQAFLKSPGLNEDAGYISLFDMHTRLEPLIQSGQVDQAVVQWRDPVRVYSCDNTTLCAAIEAYQQAQYMSTQIPESKKGVQMSTQESLRRRKLM